MADGVIKVATCQFAVGASIKRNSRTICDFLRKAKKAKADIVHFSECALSGYVGTDFPNFEGYNWDLLKEETQKVMALARELHLWVVLGSTHPLTKPHKPHNSLYLINPKGRIVDRYDKRF
jgi:predicted amidohydrolase